MTPKSVLYRLLTDEPDYEGIVNNFIDHVRCRPEESQATANSVRNGKLHERFSLFVMLPAELRQKIWKMSVDPVLVTGYLTAPRGLISNSVVLSNYTGPGNRSFLGTRDHYQEIRLFQINRESRELAFAYWGSPLPSSKGELPAYLFNTHTDTLAIQLSYSHLSRNRTARSNVIYESSPWQGIGRPEVAAQAPTAMLSRIHRIELQLDRVEDLQPGGYDWTRPGATNPFTFLFHFRNLRHLSFVFRRPRLIDIPQTTEGITVINVNRVLPVTEAVKLYDYYHLETIQCLHSFVRLFQNPSTQDEAKTALRNLRTISITANPMSLRLDPYWLPNRHMHARIAKIPKGASPLACANDNNSLEVVSPVVPGNLGSNGSMLEVNDLVWAVYNAMESALAEAGPGGVAAPPEDEDGSTFSA
ncbi:hypothetical protein NEUTE1DRAFT_125484 [Neurospora tetrasperma FGSC 2508]|uniref:2EXR domain-containing protein n=1 Tax=Neurospora tetrasperma (strain FGSC 2508 / ATCC MYA-4615 / P0657) TaxID=510951 RepID=F8N4A1_NEUT8|nr:uncharacterized protein NEUTE1DRAFT_125484 [Neurospora tetrasperma FGSC 2508]EGO51844.1 hypothetical protein NEUTE1DRAFT_125484 [Neurospora tetrasperma FGSC 2508]